MIQEIVGDLLRDGKGMICHQVNYQGVMGGGIAYSIAEKLLSQKQYREYQRLCMKKGKKLLGTNWYAECGDIIVANMFCQNAEPRIGQTTLTNYVAMELCFRCLRDYAEARGVPIYLPARIGCGIAGGDWNRVKAIIKNALGAATVPVTIVYWEGEAQAISDEPRPRMSLQDAVLWLKKYQGYEPLTVEDCGYPGRHKHFFDLTDETVDVLLEAIEGKEAATDGGV